jgi:hypothetical protein
VASSAGAIGRSVRSRSTRSGLALKARPKLDARHAAKRITAPNFAYIPPEPIDTAPEPVDPTVIDPGATDPTATADPAAADPAAADPAAADPTAAAPATTTTATPAG